MKMAVLASENGRYPNAIFMGMIDASQPREGSYS